ncbi:MAG: hypothetical protein ACFFEF_02550 [Candidatus Thorarchaeota archaeon]
MNLNSRHAVALLLLGVFLVGIQPVAGTPIRTFAPAQVAEPFEEMMTGVYVATQWWNQSSDDWRFYTNTGTYEYYHYVEDADGDVYWILDSSIYDIYDEWEFTNLLVVIILDPDASVMSWLSANDWTNPYPTYPTDPSTPGEPVNATGADDANYPIVNNDTDITYDLWTLFWNPPIQAMNGDEVFVYSSFYFSYSYSDIYYETNYTWYDENMQEVNPNDVIPNLAEEYMWAAWYNESWLYDEEWSYYGFGYDISEMTRVNDQIEWMNHYYSGMSTYNDTNGNGIMDIVYQQVEYDFNEDGIVDWTTYTIDTEDSEKVYEFYSYQAALGDVSLPKVNDNGQIEWGAEVTNIKGDFWTYTPYDVFVLENTFTDTGSFVEPESVPAEVEYLEMVYRFEVTDEAAIVKIDQLIGDFNDPLTDEAIMEIQGLGLSMNYWSSFSSSGIVPETMEGPVDYTGVYNAEPAPGGGLEFVQNSSDFMSISFGGTYVWGYDGATYEVGTVILPNYNYRYPCFEGTLDSASASSQDIGWSYSTFYYSSCYSNWDGYEIIHDPVYAVYPMIAPGSVSSIMAGILTASWILGIGGLAVLSIVIVRNINLRRMQ